MSTRVQKGGTVFKPVAKPRPRMGSEARQTSHGPEHREHRASAPPSADHGMASAPKASMPPPSIVPQKPPSSGPAAQTPTTRPASAPTPPAVSTVPLISTAIATPSRYGVRPPAVQSRPPPSSLPPTQEGNSRSVPTVINIPPRSSARLPQAEAISHHPVIPSGSSQTFVPSLQHDVEFVEPGSYAISDAQIDPALLEAVVTALRHVDESQSASIDDASQGTQRLAINSEPVKVPPSRKRQSRNRAAADPTTEEDEPATRTRGRRLRSSATGDAGTSSTATRRRRSTRQSSEAPDEDSDDDSRPRRKRPRRARAPSVPPFDPDADPGEEIDPTAVTMAELCDDLGRGKVSSKAAQIVSNHVAWRAANKEKRARLRAIAEAKKYGRDLEEEENATAAAGPSTKTAEGNEAATNVLQGSEATAGHVGDEETGDRQGDDYDYTQAMSTSRFNVQVRIGPNGETIIDEASLFVDRQEEDETIEYTHIEESDTTKFVNSMTYSKKVRGSRWSAEETELFFDALQQFGENYELISYILPGRDRKACKNKFKAEDKRNPNRINYCLKNRRPYDMQTLARMTGKDFSGPPPVIKAPTPPQLVDEQTGENTNPDDDASARKRSTTPAEDYGEEVIGLIDE